ncbi:MAG: type II toxin-antitoxin system MqsR family toxin [Gallionellaceae bacterium]|jgi:motility quorum-sensing regulator/GCU-specific mRNA interferase toxin|nr:type II toxin-antitoxin system MqsR family toxin [Gallionellaceae bacterium]
MEKRRPHYRLEAIKAVVAIGGSTAFTNAALRGVKAMKISSAEAISVVLALENRHFYKSMTTHDDHRIWQDVYHALCSNGRWAYIKLTLRDDGAVVIQFKEI